MLKQDCLKEDLSKYCIDGDLIGIQSLLDVLSLKDRNELVNSFCDSINPSYKNLTMLSIACINNHLDMVKYLIEKCSADKEMLVCLNINEDWDNMTFFTKYLRDFTYEAAFNITATTFWHCCRSASLDIVKYFIKSGVDINSTKETCLNSSPLM